MALNELNWMVGGPQGGGINTIAETLAKALSRGGLHVFANIEYHSNIMGKHAYYQVRCADGPIRSHRDQVNLLVALDRETLFGDLDHEYPSHYGHLRDLTPGGAILHDAAIKLSDDDMNVEDVSLFPLPYDDILKQAMTEVNAIGQASKYAVVRNAVALGASVGLMRFDIDILTDVLTSGLRGKAQIIRDLNVAAARLGALFAQREYLARFPFHLPAVEQRERFLLTRGVQAVGIGKLAAGCSFQTYYPISPATDESVFLERQQSKYNILVVQTEDELSSINMAVGAAHAGARSSTATSGPGFALMAEGLGFGSITECAGPVVSFYQRGGPSTGLPTRQEQADLRFAIQPAPGDFQHIVTAPGDMLQAFEDAWQSFNWADRYQMPIILLLDKHLAGSYETIDTLPADQVYIDRGKLWQGAQNNGHEPYRRYQLSEDGISARSFPGQPGGQFTSTSDEHDIAGHISEGIENRIEQMTKRFHKLDVALDEISVHQKLVVTGPADADVTLLAWGSTRGAILDALPALEEAGIRANFVQVRLMRPFPVQEVANALESAKTIISIEGNFTGQLEDLVRQQTGVVAHGHVRLYVGRPFSQDEVVAGVQAECQRLGVAPATTAVAR